MAIYFAIQGIGAWEPNSRVVHATAKTFAGPYTKQSVVVAPFAHEPNAVRSPDGDWVIYMTMRHPAGGAINCTPKAATLSSPSSENQQRFRSAGPDGLPEPRHTYMTYSKNPDGPWSAPVLVLKANYSVWYVIRQVYYEVHHI